MDGRPVGVESSLRRVVERMSAICSRCYNASGRVALREETRLVEQTMRFVGSGTAQEWCTVPSDRLHDAFCYPTAANQEIGT